ncbi:MAG: DUF4373 domain-containing protein [Bacteroidetes bacterium]|nr:DUF4373 domain-containing protein [Bacteroidota bacterium]
MARPRKLNADYFPFSTTSRSELSLRAVRRKFGIAGYGAYVMLLEFLGHSDNFQAVIGDKEMELLAVDFEVESDWLRDLINYLIMFELMEWQDDGVMYSPFLKKVFVEVIHRNREATNS